jgi:phosphatidylglycerophosphatase A
MSIFLNTAVGRHNLTPLQIMSDPVLFLAFGFGSGLAKKAPGTFGTLAAVPLYLLLVQTGQLPYWILTALVSVFGIWICGKAAEKLGEHDFGGIVWDEIAGLLVTLAFVPFSWPAVIVGFVLFRLFDIVKPWPIRWIDQQVTGGLGIMLDDIVAGFFAAGVMAFWF